MTEKNRIRNISTRFLELYRYGFVVLMIGLIGLILFSKYQQYKESGRFPELFTNLVLCYFIYVWLKSHAKVYRVEFDDDYLYVIRKKQDVLIPLENIKDITLKTFFGMWQVDLFYADIVGERFYFKPSLLYPINSKSKDALVNVLWQKIDVAKKKKPHFQANALHS
jgi:hypothetical protein